MPPSRSCVNFNLPECRLKTSNTKAITLFTEVPSAHFVVVIQNINTMPTKYTIKKKKKKKNRIKFEIGITYSIKFENVITQQKK